MKIQDTLNLLLAKETVDDVVAAYEKACVAGYKGTVQAKAPPGLENMVLKLKEKYGEDSDSPFKIAWWRYNQNQKKKD